MVSGMNLRVVLLSLTLLVFGVMIIVGTLYYNATNGFTQPATFYTTSTSIDTMGFKQGLVAIAVSGSFSSTITSQTEPGITLYVTQVNVGFIPFQSQQSNLFYALGVILFVIALTIPLALSFSEQYRRQKESTKVY